jgi:hypothetical protein
MLTCLLPTTWAGLSLFEIPGLLEIESGRANTTFEILDVNYFILYKIQFQQFILFAHLLSLALLMMHP